ncbi:hypothetical protein T459_10012 [Capsicum annuum]|uniref:Uncharacterized protein n=1 Tax=Capsicum annuum TaxID=4072 RepID=A0A2G3A127_CAPAN|nr:hypothetical protein T459_10012 [Capsicum annuum]
MRSEREVLVLGPACLALCQVVLEILSLMVQTAPTTVMIRRTATSGVQNFYPPMGQTVSSEVMIRRTAMSRVIQTVYIQPQACEQWRLLRIISMLAEGAMDISSRLAAEDNTNAIGGSSGQGNVNG